MSVSFSFKEASNRFNSAEFATEEGPTETRPLPGVLSLPVFKAADEVDLTMVLCGVAFNLLTAVREAVVLLGDVAMVGPLVFEAVRLVPRALTAPVLSLDCVVGAGLRVKYDLRVGSVSSA